MEGEEEDEDEERGTVSAKWHLTPSDCLTDSRSCLSVCPFMAMELSVVRLNRLRQPFHRGPNMTSVNTPSGLGRANRGCSLFPAKTRREVLE